MDSLLTVAETAERLRVSPSMIRKLIKNDSLSHLRIGTRVVIPEGMLKSWIAAHLNNGGRK